MRLLGVDFGGTRIGIALGESEFQVATPRQNLAASGRLGTDAEAIVAIAKKEQVDAIVLGLPVEPDGNEGKMARICRQLGDRISALGSTVHFVDESMTSVEAMSDLSEQGLKGSERKRAIDGEAARRILERFMVEQK